jgi:2-keto-4-pentenoate hydratase/2-oxohepta-3-ene-1,7-dioic acid hydratase in catechol pathway
MRIARFSRNGVESWGVVKDGVVYSIKDRAGDEPPLDSTWWAGRGNFRLGDGWEAGETKFLAPVPRPSKIIAVGLNYHDHASEAGTTAPATPILFAKFPSSIVGPTDPIVLPPESEQIDWEVELAVVIGRRGHRVSEGDALDYVLGYTILIDVSARDLQASDGQWVRAKSFDTFAPIGPWITTTDELNDASNCPIELRINGVVKQSSNTARLVVDVPGLVSFASQTCTLEPGDLIATGTPAGVGAARNPPEFLRDGDEIRAQIGGIGELRNPVARPGLTSSEGHSREHAKV